MENAQTNQPVKITITQEFLEFLKKYQVIGLAIAFVIGSAATKMVTGITNDTIMPIVTVLIPGGNWQTSILQIGVFKFLIGDLISQIINFLIIALVVFLIVRFLMKEDPTIKR